MDHPIPDHDPNTLPRRTTPTWEMEVLLSGATVFAVWQVVAAMAPLASYLVPRLPAEILQWGGVLYIYVAGGLIMVGLAFTLHLALRAYWVALVGMHSVYPQGLRIEGIKAGPVMRALLLSRWPDMPQAIEKADNRATVVFGLGIGVAAVLVPITLSVTILYALSFGLSWALGWMHAVSWVFLAATMGFLLPMLSVQLLDRALAGRLVPGSRTYRAFSAVLGVYRHFGMSRESIPLVTIYSSNVGDRRGNIVVLSIMAVSLLLAVALLTRENLHLGPGGTGGFPTPWRGTAATVDGRHYASLQEPDAMPGLPFLPSPIQRGDYARLVVPYLPARHAEALAGCQEGADESAEEAAKTAPDRLRDAMRESAQRTALLECYSRHFDLRLDGSRLALQPDWFMDPSRDLRGLIYMVPLQDLAPGRHELQLSGPDSRFGQDAEEQLPLPDRIPFWR